MSLLQRVDDTNYPESDGRPMGETDVHIEWTIRIRDILKYRHRDQRVYVASNLLVYYQQGEPSKFVVPDDFVVLDCDAGPRRTFKTWEEEKSRMWFSRSLRTAVAMTTRFASRSSIHGSAWASSFFTMDE